MEVYLPSWSAIHNYCAVLYCAVLLQKLPTPSSTSLRELLATAVTSKLRGLEVSQDWKLVDTSRSTAMLCCAVLLSSVARHYIGLCYSVMCYVLRAALLVLANITPPCYVATLHPCCCMQVMLLVCTTLSPTWALSGSI